MTPVWGSGGCEEISLALAVMPISVSKLVLRQQWCQPANMSWHSVLRQFDVTLAALGSQYGVFLAAAVVRAARARTCLIFAVSHRNHEVTCAYAPGA